LSRFAALERFPVRSLALAGSLVLLLFAPSMISIYGLTLLTEIFIYSIFAMSLNLLIGSMGYTSLGHATFFGAGGYFLAILITKGGFQNFFFCMGATLLMAALFSSLLGLIAVRVAGIYFLMITLAIGQVFWATAWSWRSVTGGDDGLSGISRPVLRLLGRTWSFSHEINFYYLILFFFVLCLVLLFLISRSPFGRALLGIRNNEMRMRTLGYNTWTYKYACYGLAGVFASVAGALKVYQDASVSASYASLTQSGLVLLMVIIGGAKVFLGPVAGVFIIQIIAGIVSSYTEYWSTIMGSALILSVMFFPEGVAGFLVHKTKAFLYESDRSRESV
jgi:branched-chain amino acid transport system permease protein